MFILILLLYFFFVTFPFGTQFTHTFSLSQNDLYTNRGLLQSILNLDCNAFSEFVGYFENVKLPLQAANYFGIQIEIAVPCSFRLRVIRWNFSYAISLFDCSKFVVRCFVMPTEKKQKKRKQKRREF